MDNAAPQYEPWDFGRPLHGYAWRRPGARANLLLQHGFGEHAGRYVDHYSRLVPHLLDTGFNVFAFDAEGHGRSSGDRGLTCIRTAVDDHQVARDKLTTNGTPLYLFGHSLGGLITAASVAKDQRQVAGVILSAPALVIELNPLLKMVAGLVSSVAPAARLTPALDAAAISRDEAEVAAYCDDPLVCRSSPAAKLGATAVKVLEKAWKRFPDWQVPVLVIHGTDDRLTPYEGSRKFIETIAAEDKTLETYEGGYHELLNDFDRDKALSDVLSWLRARMPVAA